MSIESLKSISMEIMKLLSDYHNPPDREMAIDPVLYALLRSRHEKKRVTRQHPAHLPQAKRPPRIDYRIGGTNPLMVELVVRPRAGGVQLYGSQNKTELRKLCRIPNTQCKLRALLLLDFHAKPHAKADLKASYDPMHAGRGKFTRHPVRVIYVHRDTQYTFTWSPFRPVAA